MRSAMILVGHELAFWQRAKELESYLRHVVGLRHVALTEGWNRDRDALEAAFMNHASKAGRQPFLLAYIGHGYKDKFTGEKGWSYGVYHGEKDLRLPYKTLLWWLIESRDGPTLLLNDCCYADAFSSLPEFKTCVGLKISTLAASVENGYCHGELTPDVITSWTKREPYVPKTREGTLETCKVIEARFGPVLDHHFFPKPP